MFIFSYTYTGIATKSAIRLIEVSKSDLTYEEADIHSYLKVIGITKQTTFNKC